MVKTAEGVIMEACGNAIDKFNLDRVIMPMIRIMRDARLSWSEREEISDAIRECLRHHRALTGEQDMLNQTANQLHTHPPRDEG